MLLAGIHLKRRDNEVLGSRSLKNKRVDSLNCQLRLWAIERLGIKLNGDVVFESVIEEESEGGR
jgi:hypothetical protein